MPVAIVYLTDGFERLDLPGRSAEFRLDDDWILVGAQCVWVWPHDAPGTVAGAEIVAPGGTWQVDVGSPVMLTKGNRLVARPRVRLDP